MDSEGSQEIVHASAVNGFIGLNFSEARSRVERRAGIRSSGGRGAATRGATPFEDSREGGGAEGGG